MCEKIARQASKIDLNVTDKLTLLVLSVWAVRETSECHLSCEEIANYSGQKVRTVIKNIAFLQSIGLVSVIKNNDSNVFIVRV